MGGAASSIGKAFAPGGGDGSVGGFLGGASPASQMFGNYLDPLDVLGNQSRDQYNKSMDVYNANNAKINEQMGQRPGYQSVMSGGQLGDQYRMTAANAGNANMIGASTGTADQLDMADLDRRMGLAGNVSARQVEPAAQVQNQSVAGNVGTINAGQVGYNAVGTGSNYDNAQTDLGRLRSEANATGPSQSAQAQLAMADRNRGSAMDQIAAGRAGQYASTTDDLAAAGGLEGGARERVARNADRNAMLSRQGVMGNDAMSRLGITANDEQSKAALRQAMPSMSMGMDQYKTGLAAQNSDRQFQADQYNANAGMQAQQANVANRMNASMFDAGQNMAAQQFNVSADQARQQANAGLDMNAQQYNSGLAMQKAGMFGSADQAQSAINNNMEQFNANAYHQASAYNANAANQMQQYNAGLAQSANQYNANAASMDSRLGNQYALDAWGQNMAALGAQASAGQMAQNQPQGGLFTRLLGMQS